MFKIENEELDPKKANINNKIQMNDVDLKLLKNSILFKYWNNVTFNEFINDNKIYLQSFKYKEIVANEKQCNEKIFIIKSGDVLVWIKVKRLHLKKYQKIIERYNQNLIGHSHVMNTNIDTLKSKYERDENINLKSLEFLANSKDSIKNIQVNKQEQISSFNSNNLANNSINQDTKNTFKLPPIPMASLTSSYKYNIINNKAKLDEMISKTDGNTININKTKKLPMNQPNVNIHKSKPTSSNNQLHLPRLKKKKKSENPKPFRRKRRSRLPRIPKFKPIKSILNNRLSSMLNSAKHRNSLGDGSRVKKLRFSNISIVYKSNSAKSARVRSLFDWLETGSNVSKYDLDSEHDENEATSSRDGENSSTRDSENEFENDSSDDDGDKSEYVEPPKALKDSFKTVQEVEEIEHVLDNVDFFDLNVEKNKALENFNNYLALEIKNDEQTDDNKLNDDNFSFDFLTKEQIELNNISMLKTELPEIWRQGFGHSNRNKIFCFVKMMRLNPNEFFGLSDYLFDEQREQEKIMKVAKEYNEDSEDEILSSNPSRANADYSKQIDKFENQVNSKKPNKYYLITNSKYAECYVIDREAYLKYFLLFTTDKSLINKYLDDLRNICPKLPTSKKVNQDFSQHLTWNIYKKQNYKNHLDLVNLNSKLTKSVNLATDTKPSASKSNSKSKLINKNHLLNKNKSIRI